MAAENELRRVQKLTSFTEDIIHFGLWKTDSGVDNALMEIPTSTDVMFLKTVSRIRQP